MNFRTLYTNCRKILRDIIASDTSNVTQHRRGRRLDTRRHVNYRSAHRALNEIYDRFHRLDAAGFAFCDSALFHRRGHNNNHQRKR